MTARRFTSHPDLDPTAVRSLAAGHPAMVDNRTLFPSTVVDVTRDAPDRLLVSGANNRKLGATIIKGTYAGYLLYGLSLEERATCPASCLVRGHCYGNGMQMARRHRIGDMGVFHERLTDEIDQIIRASADGLIVRLHVLGDFPSVEYVAMWADLLADHPKLACYGYTHRLPKRAGGEIGDAIAGLKTSQPDRFRIRWSSDTTRTDSARVIHYVPRGVRVEQGVVCPAQLKDDMCCAACSFCWEPRAKLDNVVFILHGAKSMEVAAANARREIARAQPDMPNQPASRSAPMVSNLRPFYPKPVVPPPNDDQPVEKGDDEPTVEVLALPAPGPARMAPVRPAAPRDARIAGAPCDTRHIAAISIPPMLKPRPVTDVAPTLRLVLPTDLRIEAAYQRDLSGRSIALIRKIVTGWDWAKFKPPVCADTENGLFVLDGQHTAIAAASHPDIVSIPVMVVDAERLEARADAFVAHNRDRLAMSQPQILHAEAAAGGAEAVAILDIVHRQGASVPRNALPRGQAKPGEIVCASALRRIYRSGPALLERVIKIGVMASCAPVTTTVAYGLQMLLAAPYFAEAALASDSKIADAIHGIGPGFEVKAEVAAANAGVSRYRAAAEMIRDAVLRTVAA